MSKTWLGVAAAAVLAAGPAWAQLANLPPDVRSAIAALGPNLNPAVIEKSFALMGPLEAPRDGMTVERDLSYGTDPLQKLDLWLPKAKGRAPIVVFVHGGGFARGDKKDYDNIPAYFARHGFLGVNVNYRLAPAVAWPAASEDVGGAVAWLKANAAAHGGDPRRIVVIGHSAGASAVASYVLDRSIKAERSGVIGAVIISGPLAHGVERRPQDAVYFGKDPKAETMHEPLGPCEGKQAAAPHHHGGVRSGGNRAGQHGACGGGVPARRKVPGFPLSLGAQPHFRDGEHRHQGRPPWPRHRRVRQRRGAEIGVSPCAAPRSRQ